MEDQKGPEIGKDVAARLLGDVLKRNIVAAIDMATDLSAKVNGGVVSESDAEMQKLVYKFADDLARVYASGVANFGITAATSAVQAFIAPVLRMPQYKKEVENSEGATKRVEEMLAKAEQAN